MLLIRKPETRICVTLKHHNHVYVFSTVLSISTNISYLLSYMFYLSVLSVISHSIYYILSNSFCALYCSVPKLQTNSVWQEKLFGPVHVNLMGQSHCQVSMIFFNIRPLVSV